MTDLDTLDILYETLETLVGYEEIKRSLWENAAKAKPHDLELQTRWFTIAFENGDWKSAQKVGRQNEGLSSSALLQGEKW